MQATVTVKLSQSHFAKGLKYAKQVGGRFNTDTKTWAIPASRPELGAASAYGWVIVQPAACPHYTINDGCPRHGATCPAAR
jgi:hypothetical protein